MHVNNEADTCKNRNDYPGCCGPFTLLFYPMAREQIRTSFMPPPATHHGETELHERERVEVGDQVKNCT